MTPRSVYFPRRRVLVVAAVVLTLAGAGCARQTPSGSPARPTPTASSATPSSSSPSPAPPGATVPAPSATPSGPLLTLDGTARRGVEPNCTILDTADRKTYLLLGVNGGTPDQKAIPLGVPLRVRGVEVDQLVSYCQQGTPVEVVDVTRR